MLSLEKIREIIPEIEGLSEEELIKLRDILYPTIEKILDHFFEENDVKIEI